MSAVDTDRQSRGVVDAPADLPSELRERLAEARRRFDRIRLDYPPQDEAVDMLDDVRLSAQGRDAGAQCGGAVLVAPHGTGKTVTVQKLCQRVNADAGEGRIPALHIKISTSGTTESVATSILTALKRPRPDLGKEALRWSKAISAMRQAGVELALFDDFDRASRRPTMSKPIADVIRERIIDEGVCPVAFVGSESAGSVLRLVPDLMERLDDQIDLEPLDWLYGPDREIFATFAKALDHALVSELLLPTLSGLGTDGLAERLCESAGGRVRRLMKIVRLAMASAIRRNARKISEADLELAVDSYVLPRKFLPHNPFTEKQS